jgi:hypothetical protein
MRIYEYEETWWDDIHRENFKNSDKNWSQCHFDYHKSHMD